MANGKKATMTEEELRRTSAPKALGTVPSFPYDTQTRKFVGSDFSPQRPVEPTPMTNLQRAQQYEGLPPHLQSSADRMGMSTQSKGVVDAVRSPLSGINSIFDTSIQGMGVDRSPIATRVPEMPSGLAGSSPFNLAGATQQTSPLLTNQVPEMPVNIAQAKTPIQTPYGTVYATARQMGNERVSEMGGLPAQSARLENIGERARQSAAVKQMRERGAAIAQNYTQTMKDFAESRGPRFSPMPAPQGRYGQSLVNLFPQSQEAVAQRTERNAPILASTGFGAMQRAGQAQQQQFASSIAPFATPSLFGGMGYTAPLLGGPQPASPMLASSSPEEERRKSLRRTLGLA
jgi:hypothetical protein